MAKNAFTIRSISRIGKLTTNRYYIMKHLLIIAMLTMATLSHAAGWTHKVYDADPMKSNTKYVEYTYTDDNGNSFVWSTNDRENFVLKTTGSIFVSDSEYFIGMVGFYTRDWEFEFKMPLMLAPNMSQTTLTTKNEIISSIPSNQKWIDKVIEYIVVGGGHVRFIFSRYNDTDFDLTVPRIEESDMVFLDEI